MRRFRQRSSIAAGQVDGGVAQLVNSGIIIPLLPSLRVISGATCVLHGEIRASAARRTSARSAGLFSTGLRNCPTILIRHAARFPASTSVPVAARTSGSGNQSSVFSDWSFICEGCGHTRELIQNDPLTWEALDRQRAGGGRTYEPIEYRMLPVSYRANSAFYPQKGAFIEFRDRNVVDLLRPERQGELLRHIAQIHGFAYSSPSDAEIEPALAVANRSAEWQDYTDHIEMAERADARGQRDRAETLRRQASELKEAWYDQDVISRGQVQSRELAAAVAARNEWARRYDPLRLTIEHDRFVAEHILERRRHHEAIDVLEPDRLICDAVGDPTALEDYRQRVGSLLQRIGIQQLVLIRGLPICEFSFGFTPRFVRSRLSPRNQ